VIHLHSPPTKSSCYLPPLLQASSFVVSPFASCLVAPSTILRTSLTPFSRLRTRSASSQCIIAHYVF
jgi:hypothetical protein